MKLGLIHLAWSASFSIVAAVLAKEGWGVALAVLVPAVVAFHLGRAIPRGAGRLRSMAWWLPPVCVLLILVID